MVSVNFASAAGEWTYFDEYWLKEKIVNYIAGVEKGYRGDGFISLEGAHEIISTAWSKVCKYLPKEYIVE